MSSRPWPKRAFQLPWRSGSEIDRELDEEFAFHIEQRTAKLVASGMSPADARRESLRRFGDLVDARAYCRAMDRGQARSVRRRDWITGWRQDLAFATRQLFRSPGFTLIAVITLALGVGANTAIFSVVHRVLVDPLPYPGGDRMVALTERSVSNQMMMTPEQKVVTVWQAQSKQFERIEQFDEGEASLKIGTEVENVAVADIPATLTAFLGISPSLGRAFLAEETAGDGAPVVMLGYGLWQRRFGGRRDVLGTTIEVDGKLRTIIGVMPRDIVLPTFNASPKQLWLPLGQTPQRPRIQALGRLREGVTPAQAASELTAIEKSISLDEPNPHSMQFEAAALRPLDLSGGDKQNVLLLLFAVVGVVLLIACANVANLLLARASSRTREFAIRTALGAGRGRLVRQLLTESLLLALLGGVIGVLLAARGLDLLVTIRPDSLQELDEIRLQPIALLWSLGLSIGTGILFGLAPVLLATERHVSDTIKGSVGGAGSNRGSRRLRAALVIAEVAMSVMLLVGAGLLIRTVRQMQRVEVGFNPADLTAIGIRFQEGPDSLLKQKRAALSAEILAAVRAVPGVEKATWASGVPPRSGVAFGELEIEGKTLTESEKTSLLGYTLVQREYFDALQLPIKRGHGFAPNDRGMVVINEGMARRFWPSEDAIGKRFRMDKAGEWQTVAGLVSDVRIPGRRSGGFDALQTYHQMMPEDMRENFQLLVRTRGEMRPILGQIQAVIDGHGTESRVAQIVAVQEMLDQVMAAPRFSMLLFTIFAALALILAMIGLYGVISYSVGQRTREIGVRIALGAGTSSVLGMVVRQGLQLTVVGVMLGLLAAAAGTRAMQSLLYEVSPLDPLTFIAVAGTLVTVAAVAAWLPARRATRVDPVVALRSE